MLWQWGGRVGPEYPTVLDRDKMKVLGPPEPPPEPPTGDAPFKVTTAFLQDGSLYIVKGNCPVPGTAINLTAWGHTRTEIAGSKPPDAGGFEFSLPDVGDYTLSIGGYTYALPVSLPARGVVTLVFS